MSEEGERTCPLCAEEMDLTDLQLKACKCGYEVWISFINFQFRWNQWKLEFALYIWFILQVILHGKSSVMLLFFESFWLIGVVKWTEHLLELGFNEFRCPCLSVFLILWVYVIFLCWWCDFQVWVGILLVSSLFWIFYCFPSWTLSNNVWTVAL